MESNHMSPIHLDHIRMIMHTKARAGTRAMAEATHMTALIDMLVHATPMTGQHRMFAHGLSEPLDEGFHMPLRGDG